MKGQGDSAIHISSESARGGEIVLRKPWERGVFFAGLAGMVTLFLILSF